MASEDIAHITAELEIRSLIARIAMLADHGELDEYIDQFTEDSVWDFPGGARRGRDDIRAGAEQRRSDGVTGPGSGTRHVITTVSVQVDGPETARANSYFLFFQNAGTVPTIFNMGLYQDDFVRDDAVWRLARRGITLG